MIAHLYKELRLDYLDKCCSPYWCRQLIGMQNYCQKADILRWEYYNSSEATHLDLCTGSLAQSGTAAVDDGAAHHCVPAAASIETHSEQRD